MSPVRSDDPLRRVTLNLYEADCVVMEKRYGHGWTTVVRDWVNQHARGEDRIKVLNDLANEDRRRTLGDLTDD